MVCCLPMSGRFLQLTANSDIRRSGEPSRLSLRKQWIFRRAFSNDIDRQHTIPAANLRYWVYEAKKRERPLMCGEVFWNQLYLLLPFCIANERAKKFSLFFFHVYFCFVQPSKVNWLQAVYPVYQWHWVSAPEDPALTQTQARRLSGVSQSQLTVSSLNRCSLPAWNINFRYASLS